MRSRLAPCLVRAEWKIRVGGVLSLLQLGLGYAMVNSITPTHPTISPKTPAKKDQAASTDTIGDQSKNKPSPQYQKPLKERRKGGDRRTRQGSRRPVYDMRISRGRRKSDRGGVPNIETEA